ncbi:MAG TPA: TolC family protein, partial [Opitutus sp.]|nr:TolC family protein [Opitutus sp.]
MRSCAWLLVVGLCAGCAHTAYRAEPLSPDAAAAAFDARSLADPGLRQFLADNLGRAFPTSTPADWDFETLAWVAFYFNPALDVARAQWETARAAIATAGARPNPSLTVTPGYNTSARGGITPWLPAVGLDLPLETAGKRDRRADAARHAADAARQSVFAAAWQVRSELRTALVDFTGAQARAAALHTEADLQRDSAALLEQRLRAGAIAAPEVAAAQLAAVRAEADAAGADRAVPVARQRIASALGLPASALDGIALHAPASVAALTPEQLAAARRQSLQSRPDILAALASYAAAESSLALEVAKQTPDLHLGPGYQYDQGENKWTLG